MMNCLLLFYCEILHQYLLYGCFCFVTEFLFLLNYLPIAQEEHFVSILNFSWPQVTCVTQCPIRGSRVVFVSFCDKSKQVVFVYHKNKM